MRALLHHAYESHRPDLLLSQLSFIGKDIEFYTIYDYGIVPPKFQVLPLSHPVCSSRNPLWVDAVARASRSEGRMEIHGISLLDGSFRIIPLRSSRPDIYTGLRQIARDIPPGADVVSPSAELKDKIEVLLKEASEVIQIHCD